MHDNSSYEISFAKKTQNQFEYLNTARTIFSSLKKGRKIYKFTLKNTWKSNGFVLTPVKSVEVVLSLLENCFLDNDEIDNNVFVFCTHYLLFQTV